MEVKSVDILLSEMVKGSGFVNLDQNDIDNFKQSVASLDAEKLKGTCSEVGSLLMKGLNALILRNENKPFSNVLFSIKISEENKHLMDYVENVYDVIEHFTEEINSKWGISINGNLKGDEVELIVVIGFGREI